MGSQIQASVIRRNMHQKKSRFSSSVLKEVIAYLPHSHNWLPARTPLLNVYFFYLHTFLKAKLSSAIPALNRSFLYLQKESLFTFIWSLIK